MPLMRVEDVGYGAGTLRLDFPNVTRVMVGEEQRERVPDEGGGPPGEVVLETNIDDLNPELYEYVLERLLAAGAQDAWLTPIVMKKSRPAVKVSVLCAPAQEGTIRGVLFRETGTLGVRTVPVVKHALGRQQVEVKTEHGRVAVKIGYLDVQRSQASQVIKLDPTYKYPPNHEGPNGTGFDGQLYYYIALDPANARYYIDRSGGSNAPPLASGRAPSAYLRKPSATSGSASVSSPAAPSRMSPSPSG